LIYIYRMIAYFLYYLNNKKLELEQIEIEWDIYEYSFDSEIWWEFFLNRYMVWCGCVKESFNNIHNLIYLLFIIYYFVLSGGII
jgi:hypothetical protein